MIWKPGSLQNGPENLRRWKLKMIGTRQCVWAVLMVDLEILERALRRHRRRARHTDQSGDTPADGQDRRRRRSL